MTNTLTVRNLAQKIIYERELAGQISDGHWENETTDERLWDCEVEVALQPPLEADLGCNFRARGYLNFDDPDLHWLLESRTLGYVQEVSPDYTVEQLHEDLQDLTEIVFGRV